MKCLKGLLVKAIGLLIIFTVLCGGMYPLVVTGISQVAFKEKANGSIIEVNGKKYGSELLGQQFTGEQYMWGRIMNSDTSTFKDEQGNKLMYATPSNLSPASESYEKLVSERVAYLKQYAGDLDKIPVDLVTCSGSGLDPHISIAAASYQVSRIAKVRGIEKSVVEDAITQATTEAFLGVFGEPTVNVLKVNLILDGVL
ncbi:potassium-transporting ATPase subunit KdpC [Niameybacter massiliensis]|uniref:potassium-transporting ATPase subunit KdpC n=1 Tax=Niameybacter massiliensis TaxID=1658108 RepID=UPI0006B4297D|nr:potassium-transporting ATPase subunit KdpC [Niameybacter massiliensis]